MLENLYVLDFGAIFFINRSNTNRIIDFYRGSPFSYLIVGEGSSSAEDSDTCSHQIDVTGQSFGCFSWEALLWPAFIVTVEQLLCCWVPLN